jgi:hypothetical protein
MCGNWNIAAISCGIISFLSVGTGKMGLISPIKGINMLRFYQNNPIKLLNTMCNLAYRKNITKKQHYRKLFVPQAKSAQR